MEQVSRKFFNWASILEPQARQQAENTASMPFIFPHLALMPDAHHGKGATVGSVVLVTSPQGELTPFGLVPKYIRFKVVGIFKSGFYDYDKSWGFIRLKDAQSLFGLGPRRELPRIEDAAPLPAPTAGEAAASVPT